MIDEIVSIRYIGEESTIDIDVNGDHLFYANNILTHNSAMEEQNHEMYHIAGGISKINTADNVMTIYTSQALKDRGEIQLQFIKTRSSSGVGHRLLLAFCRDSLRISDGEEEDEDTITTNIDEIGQKFKRKSKLEAAKENSEGSKSDNAFSDSSSSAVNTASKGAALRSMLNKINND